MKPIIKKLYSYKCSILLSNIFVLIKYSVKQEYSSFVYIKNGDILQHITAFSVHTHYYYYIDVYILFNLNTYIQVYSYYMYYSLSDLIYS